MTKNNLVLNALEKQAELTAKMQEVLKQIEEGLDDSQLDQYQRVYNNLMRQHEMLSNNILQYKKLNK